MMPMDDVHAAAERLTAAINKLNNNPITPPANTAALQNLTDIFKNEVNIAGRNDNGAEITTSTQPTAPTEIARAPRVHPRTTQHNTPRQLPPITEGEKRPNTEGERNITTEGVIEKLTESNVISQDECDKDCPPKRRQQPMRNAKAHIISQEAINVLTEQTWNQSNDRWTPAKLQKMMETQTQGSTMLEHYCSPVIHPITGETITK